MLTYRHIMLSNFYGYISYETCGSEDCAKIAKFWAKTTSHGYRSGDVNDNPDLLKDGITADESCIYGYDIETNAQPPTPFA